jgi:hypothetical protein
MMTCATKQDLEHIDERHGPHGSADARFDANFLNRKGGYAKVMQEAGDNGVSQVESDNSGRMIYRYYYNFNEKTGVGIDRDGKSVYFKGVEMVGTSSGLVLMVETMFPKGILKT